MFKKRHASFCSAPTLTALAVTVLLVTGCAAHFPEVTREGDGWTLILQRIAVGGGIRPLGYTYYTPQRGERFIQAWLKFRNDRDERRVFTHDSCDLDLDDRVILPAMVTSYNTIMVEIPKNEFFEARQVKYRMLTFAYPEDRVPTRLQCAFATFPLAPEPPPPPR